MKFLLIILLSFVSLKTVAQKEVSLKDLNKYIGDTVVVTAKVYSCKYIVGKAITLLNLGASFPNQLLTIVIKGDDRNKFADAPEKLFQHQEILVTGIVEMYNGKPQIIVTSKEQIIKFYKG